MGKILSELIQAFVKSKGAQPKGLDLIKLKQEAARLFDESRKVIDIKTKQPVSKKGIETLVKEEPSPLMKRLESYLGFQREKGSLAKKMTAGERATKNAEARLILEDPDFNDFISKESRAALKSDRTSINDPLKILEKEFGFQAVDLLPGTGSGDDVSKLIQKLKTTKDYQGRLPNDPFFDPADAFERIKTEIDVETMTPEQLFPTMPVEKEGIEKLAGQIGKPIGEFDEIKRNLILNVTKNSPEFNYELGRKIISRELYPELNQGQRKEILDMIDKVAKERGDFASGGRVNYASGGLNYLMGL